MRRLAILVMISTVLALGVSCSHRSVPLQAGASASVDVSDPVGDPSLIPGNTTKLPDLVHASFAVRDGNIQMSVRFAPGTFNLQTTQMTIQFDTDANLTTGIRNADGLGVDYALNMGAYQGGRATVIKSQPGHRCTTDDPCWVTMGTAPVVFAADGMDVIVPLSQLGGSNGHLNFKVLTSFRPTGASPAVTVDFMPDEILPAGRL